MLPAMTLRLATFDDIDAMRVIRQAVTENRLSDPTRATPEKYREMLGGRGKGWVWEVSGEIVGFAIADATSRSLWALFVMPEFERRGIGRALHDAMVGWLFTLSRAPIWLSTDAGTRAAHFYRQAGWTQQPPLPNGELCFSRSEI
jgi:GNAT superfamily N-acetyltransferase